MNLPKLSARQGIPGKQFAGVAFALATLSCEAARNEQMERVDVYTFVIERLELEANELVDGHVTRDRFNILVFDMIDRGTAAERTREQSEAYDRVLTLLLAESEKLNEEDSARAVRERWQEEDTKVTR